MELNRLLYCVVGAVALGGCAPKSDNPLLDLSDQHFRASASWYFECLVDYEKTAKTFANSSIKRDPDREARTCLEGTQKRAVGVGITENFTFAQTQDPRVKERYLALKGEPIK
jgi:hypothetical protein